MSSERGTAELSVMAKALLVLRVWRCYLRVRPRVHREPLPDFVARLGRPTRHSAAKHPALRLSYAVHRSLRLGSRQPTCLVSALVLFRLLREQDDPAELVIGLPPRASDKDAHAWVELMGVDVGPPPGQGSHAEMARFT